MSNKLKALNSIPSIKKQNNNNNLLVILLLGRYLLTPRPSTNFHSLMLTLRLRAPSPAHCTLDGLFTKSQHLKTMSNSPFSVLGKRKLSYWHTMSQNCNQLPSQLLWTYLLSCLCISWGHWIASR
jgi:hypothetical protein